MDRNSLQHHGIKGMRWGIRRFQKKDGSLTPAGKKRRNATDAPVRAPSEDYKRARSKTVKQMSDTELRTALNRIQMEQQYKNLTMPTKSHGRKLVEGILTDSAKQIATPLIVKYGTKGIDKIITNSINAAKVAKAAKDTANTVLR